MYHKSHLLKNDDLYQYLLNVSRNESDIQRLLRKTTIEQIDQSQMMTTIEQVQFLQLLIELMAVKKVIEVGVFTGYATLAMALALPPDGIIIGCEINTECLEIAKRFWRQAQIENKIHLKIGPALQTLNTLIAEGQMSSFDLVFIDADKLNYWNYYELSLQLIRSGGVIAIDNCLSVADQFVYEKKTESTKLINLFNERVHEDRRVSISLIPVGGGMMLARKK